MGEEPPDEIRETMEGYNAEDCVSAARLGLVGGEREKLVASGMRFAGCREKSGDPSEKLKDKLDRVAALTNCFPLEFLPTPAARTRRAGRAMAFGTAFELASARRQTRVAGRLPIRGDE